MEMEKKIEKSPFHQTKEIINSKNMIFIIHGTDNNRKKSLREVLEEYIQIITIPPIFIKNTFEFEDGIDNITFRMIISDYFIVELNELDDLSGGNIKKFVSGEFFHRFERILNGNRVCNKRKLVIITNSDPHNSIFTSDAGLNAKCEFISMN